MIKSGLTIGILMLVLALVSSTIISPFCIPCVGLFLGLAAGYIAGVFDKPGSANDSIRKGVIAGAIAGALGLVGGMIGGVINGAIVKPVDLNSISHILGLPNPSFSQTSIWTIQLAGGLCIGLFNVAWMALLGLVGGAIWFQISGKNQAQPGVPPQTPEPPMTAS